MDAVGLFQESSMNDMLRHHEIQRCIDDVNEQMSAEHNRLYRFLLTYLLRW